MRTNNLARLRKERGLTLCGLASRSAVDASALSRVEHGDRIGNGRRQRIAAALGVPVADVFPNCGEVKP